MNCHVCGKGYSPDEIKMYSTTSEVKTTVLDMNNPGMRKLLGMRSLMKCANCGRVACSDCATQNAGGVTDMACPSCGVPYQASAFVPPSGQAVSATPTPAPKPAPAPVADRSGYYTRSTATASVPVKITFKCAKCGRDVTLPRYLNYQETGYAGGIYNRAASAQARAKLNERVAEEIKADVEAMERGQAKLYASTNAMMSGERYFQCPGCAVYNVPDAGCERRVLMPKRLKNALVLVIGPLVLWLIGFTVCLFSLSGGWGSFPSSRDMTMSVVFPLIGVVALGLLIYFVNKPLCKKAYENPGLMEKLYGCVPNREVHADMSEHGMGDVHLGSKR